MLRCRNRPPGEEKGVRCADAVRASCPGGHNPDAFPRALRPDGHPARNMREPRGGPTPRDTGPKADHPGFADRRDRPGCRQPDPGPKTLRPTGADKAETPPHPDPAAPKRDRPVAPSPLKTRPMMRSPTHLTPVRPITPEARSGQTCQAGTPIAVPSGRVTRQARPVDPEGQFCPAPVARKQ